MRPTSAKGMRARPVRLVVAVAITAGSAVRGQGVDSSAQVTAHRLKAVLGYDAVTLAALDVPDVSYDVIAAAIMQFTEQNAGTLVPALRALEAAQANLGRPDAEAHQDAVIAELRAAHAAVNQVTTDLANSLRQTLATDTQSIHVRVAANGGLEPHLRLLDLSPAQRTAILRASVRRAGVLANPYKRNRGSMAADARAAFASVLDTVLTVDQRQALATYRARTASNLKRLLDRDRAAAALPGADAAVHRRAYAFATVVRPVLARLVAWSFRTIVSRARLNGLSAQSIYAHLRAWASLTPPDARIATR